MDVVPRCSDIPKGVLVNSLWMSIPSMAPRLVTIGEHQKPPLGRLMSIFVGGIYHSNNPTGTQVRDLAVMRIPYLSFLFGWLSPQIDLSSRCNHETALAQRSSLRGQDKSYLRQYAFWGSGLFLVNFRARSTHGYNVYRQFTLSVNRYCEPLRQQYLVTTK